MSIVNPLLLPRNSKAHILIVTDDAVAGGTYMVAERLAFGLNYHGYNVQFACMFNTLNESSRASLIESGIETFDYRVTESRLFQSTFDEEAAFELLGVTQPEIIIFEDGCIWSHLALKRAAAVAGIPFIQIENLVVDDWRDRFPSLKEIADECSKKAERIIFVSHANMDVFNAFFPDVKDKCTVIANGVPERFFQPISLSARNEVRRSIGTKESDFVILMTARIEKRKGQLLCLRAIRRLMDQGFEKIRFVIAGYAIKSDVNELMAIIEELELKNVVTFLGPREDVVELLDACDIFLLPSYAEGGAPLSLKEAMARGKPVITSDIDEISEQVRDSGCLFIPDPNKSEDDSIDKLVDQIAFLFETTSERLRRADLVRQFAEKNYRIEKVIAAYVDIIEKTRRSALRKFTIKTPRLRQRDRIFFSDPKISASFLKQGWYEQEQDGVWSEGNRSVVRLRMNELSRRWNVFFELRPFAENGHRQKLSVSTNGNIIAEWMFGDPRRTTINFSVVSFAPTDILEIVFQIDTPISPRQLGIGDDERNLGMFLYSARVTRPWLFG